jgi:hypothetical protein
VTDPLRELEGADRAEGKRVKFWRQELENAQKREKRFRREALRVVQIYEGEKRQENSFNVLFSNTETLLPACYNQLPRPYVDRRFKDEDPIGKSAATALERVLSALEDSGSAEYQPFGKLMEQAVLGALVPGRGTTWFKYDAEFEPTDEGLPEDADDTAKDAEREVEGDPVLETPQEKVKYETICGEDVDYDAFCFGPGRQWVNVPWVARYHLMTEADAVASFGKKVAGKLKYQTETKINVDGWKKENSEEQDPQGTQHVSPVWEIWNKEKKEVIFYSPSYTDDLLKVVEDPYGLSGFFPCPEPLHFLMKRSTLVPTPLYVLYEEQAKELNRITTRINKILGALKVRGFYDGTMQGLKNLLEADDNTLLPAENVAALQQGQNLQNSVWFMPFEVLVSALQALWQGREEIKDTIYEITGMADIMRGEGAASAPATLQTIKNQWGTLRLKRWQRYVQEYVRSCLRIMGELAGKHFSIETFAQITNLDYALPQDIQQAQQTLTAINQQMAQMQAQAAAQPQMGPPGGPGGAPPPMGAASPAPPGAPAGPAESPPPQEPQPTPEMQQAMQQAQDVLAKPPWEQVVGLLKNDLLRYYRIDIETNSTIASDTQEDKDDVTDALTGISQLLQSFAPMVQQGVMTMPVVKSILLTTVRKFSFGRECEDAIKQMPDQPPPPPPDPSAPTPEELDAKKQEANVKIQVAQSKLQLAGIEGQNAQQEMQQKAQETQMKMMQAQRDEESAQKQHQVKLAQMDLQMQEIAMKKQVSQMTLQMKQQELAMQGQGMMMEAETDRMTAGLQREGAMRDAQTQQALAKTQVQTAQVKAKAAKQAAAARPKNGAK